MSDTSGADDPATDIRDDILTVVGGHFTPQSLGRQVYQELRERARAHPQEYLAAFEALFLGTSFDAVGQSGLLLPTFLQQLADVDPAGVRATAERLLRQYDAVLVIYDHATDRAALAKILPEDTVRLYQRLDGRRIELRHLLGGA